MVSSKGKPTDPGLREELKEEIKAEPNKSGGGEGQWAAWKVGSLLLPYTLLSYPSISTIFLNTACPYSSVVERVTRKRPVIRQGKQRPIRYDEASKLAKEYEKQGGGYENEAGSKNQPKKGAPQAKSEKQKEDET
ncbi:hypothetical protein PG994_002541 [Apiospora phragmitis]|uniref:Uncharacterized protein n=1 Tax=Apiospora phragmitis TaxID=2905665 RepID=A0ABR1W5H5_9PEZI